jgi:Na+(H+)/acetate symporter ActP
MTNPEAHESTSRERVHRIGARAVLFFSAVALLTILIGIGQPPQPDEGTLAHIFQLAVAAILPALLITIFTGDTQRPWREARWLAIAAVVLGLAFTLLYWMEHSG